MKRIFLFIIKLPYKFFKYLMNEGNNQKAQYQIDKSYDHTDYLHEW